MIGIKLIPLSEFRQRNGVALRQDTPDTAWSSIKAVGIGNFNRLVVVVVQHLWTKDRSCLRYS